MTKQLSHFLSIIAVMLVWESPVALACTCVNPPLKYSYKDAQLMFAGRAVDVQISNGIELVAIFEVEQWLRGNLGRKVAVHSTTDGSACGFYFRQGEKYFVHAFREAPEGVVGTMLCGHTAAWEPRGKQMAQLIKSWGWWWRLPLSYPGRYPLRMWYFRHF